MAIPIHICVHNTGGMRLVDLLFDQSTQVALCLEFSDSVENTDAETDPIKREITRVGKSEVAFPLELTWCVLCIMYTCAEAMYVRLLEGTPVSIVKKWFGTPVYFRSRMESRLCGVFCAADKKSGRRGKVAEPCMTPLEIVSSAWDEYIFEATKPPDIVARENNWV